MLILFSASDFRALFPTFENTNVYPDARLQVWFDVATVYISNRYGGCYMGSFKLPQQKYALNLMTAHLLTLNELILAGNTPGITTGATVDKVSVQMQPPPETNQWQYWLNQTPYGQQLLALLQTVSVGGYYYGGFPVVGGLRR